LVDFKRLSGLNPAIERGCTAPIPAIQVPYIFIVFKKSKKNHKKKKKKKKQMREEKKF